MRDKYHFSLQKEKTPTNLRDEGVRYLFGPEVSVERAENMLIAELKISKTQALCRLLSVAVCCTPCRVNVAFSKTRDVPLALKRFIE